MSEAVKELPNIAAGQEIFTLPADLRPSDPVAERRRARALKALDAKLAEMQRGEEGGELPLDVDGEDQEREAPAVETASPEGEADEPGPSSG